jgi:hypothetical protein
MRNVLCLNIHQHRLIIKQHMLSVLIVYLLIQTSAGGLMTYHKPRRGRMALAGIVSNGAGHGESV